MHGNEHGIHVLCIKCTVRAIRDHEADLGLRPDTLVARMKARLHGLCDSPHAQHITLLTLGNQKILECPSIRICTRTTCTGPRPCACLKSSASTP